MHIGVKDMVTKGDYQGDTILVESLQKRPDASKAASKVLVLELSILVWFYIRINKHNKSQYYQNDFFIR